MQTRCRERAATSAAHPVAQGENRQRRNSARHSSANAHNTTPATNVAAALIVTLAFCPEEPFLRWLGCRRLLGEDLGYPTGTYRPEFVIPRECSRAKEVPTNKLSLPRCAWLRLLRARPGFLEKRFGAAMKRRLSCSIASRIATAARFALHRTMLLGSSRQLERAPRREIELDRSHESGTALSMSPRGSAAVQVHPPFAPARRMIGIELERAIELLPYGRKRNEFFSQPSVCSHRPSSQQGEVSFRVPPSCSTARSATPLPRLYH